MRKVWAFVSGLPKSARCIVLSIFLCGMSASISISMLTFDMFFLDRKYADVAWSCLLVTFFSGFGMFCWGLKARIDERQ
ncbi:MAG: hypothetical protein LBC79_00630 [Deltaproteobacteria bacterium]|nr:hypothetical protein [Deltaproteobacteria bacterium]